MNFSKIKSKLLNYKKTIIIILILIATIVFFKLFFMNTKHDVKINYNEIERIIIKYKVNIHIEFENNLLFSRYDVEISSKSNDKLLKHGIDDDFIFELEEGEQNIRFINNDDSSIYTDIKIDVNSNMNIGYKIKCTANKITVEELYIDKDTTLLNDEIKMTTSKDSFIEKDYKEVIKKIKELGFNNIKENPIYDITGEWLDYKDGEVESITINGKSNFKQGTIFKKDSEVIIKYHLNQNSDPSRIKVPYDYKTAIGKNYKDVEKSFLDAGFTNISVLKYSVSDAVGKKQGIVKKVEIDDQEYFGKSSTFKPDVKVTITYYDLSNELGYGFAKSAFEDYGKSKYRYGFKCHWILKNYAQEQRDKNTWYFKVGVTITNQYGADYDAIAEGIVTGTDKNPKVSQFYVK